MSVEVLNVTQNNGINKQTNETPINVVNNVISGETTDKTNNDNKINIETSKEIDTSLSVEHQQILKKEEEILTQLELKKKELLEPNNGEEEVDDGSPNIKGIAFDLFMIIVKTYFAVLLQFGDFVATSLIQTFLPDDISNQIISGNLDMKKIIPTLRNSAEALQDKEFREELGIFFVELKNVITPEIKKLLDSVFKIVVDVATKNSPKIGSILTTTLSGAFPPAALVFDAVSLAGVGINTISNGLKLAGTSLESANDLKNGIPSLDKAKNILLEKGFDTSKILKGEGIPNISKLKTDVSDTIGKSFKRFQKMSGINDTEITNIKDKASEFGDSLKTSATSAAKGFVNIVHPTTITSETELMTKKEELNSVIANTPSDTIKIAQLKNDIENYEKNKIIKEQISNAEGNKGILDRGLNILQMENVPINPDKIKSGFANIEKNATNVGTNAFGFGKAMTNALLKNPAQQGGSIKQFHNLSKKISSRILKSLKDFSNTDRINHKTKKRKPHKHTKKHRRYRK